MAEQNKGEGPDMDEIIDALEIAGMWYHDEDSGLLKAFITQLTTAETPIAIVLGTLRQLDLGQYENSTQQKIGTALTMIKSQSARQKAQQFYADKMRLTEQNRDRTGLQRTGP
jgi:hypothetical protein